MKGINLVDVINKNYRKYRKNSGSKGMYHNFDTINELQSKTFGTHRRHLFTFLVLNRHCPIPIAGDGFPASTHDVLFLPLPLGFFPGIRNSHPPETQNRRTHQNYCRSGHGKPLI